MNLADKSKHKTRAYPLRRVLFVMLAGMAFMFWMPFVIVTSNGLHWLNYAIYWGAAWLWWLPMTLWIRRHAHRSRVRRFGTALFLLVFWMSLMFGSWFVTQRGLLPSVPGFTGEIIGGRAALFGLDDSCEMLKTAPDTVRYICYAPRIRVPQTSDETYFFNAYSDNAAERVYLVSRVVAEGAPGFPFARTIEVRSDVLFATELLAYYATDHADP